MQINPYWMVRCPDLLKDYARNMSPSWVGSKRMRVSIHREAQHSSCVTHHTHTQLLFPRSDPTIGMWNKWKQTTGNTGPLFYLSLNINSVIYCTVITSLWTVWVFLHYKQINDINNTNLFHTVANQTQKLILNCNLTKFQTDN